MQRHAARHAQASLKTWISAFLTSLGEQNVTVQENTDPSELAGRTVKLAAHQRVVYVTVGARGGDGETEIGGGNRESAYDVVIDVLGAPASAAKALAEDVFDLLAGTTSYGHYVPFTNQATGQLVSGERLFLEAASMGPASAARGDWWQVGAELYRSYVPDNYL